MTLIELAKEIQEIESKYSRISHFKLGVSVDQKLLPTYTLEHTTYCIYKGTYNVVSIGYGTTDIRELLTKFDMTMATHYRFINDKKNNEDITLTV
jgi:hypothetical protein